MRITGSNRRLYVARLLLGGLVFLAGCAGTGGLSGTVTYKGNGKKLMSGTVMVLCSDNVPRYGMIGEDGTYSVAGVPPGPAKVTVTSPDPGEAAAEAPAARGGGGRARPGGAASRATPPSGLSGAAAKGWFAIPDRYGDPARTPLTVQVKGGKNPHDIQLDP
jgi:hypothetical protein